MTPNTRNMIISTKDGEQCGRATTWAHTNQKYPQIVGFMMASKMVYIT